MELSAGCPHVWIFDVQAPRFGSLAEREVASAQERTRAERMTNPDAARRLLARRTALRLLLSRYVGCGPSDLRIVNAPGGKPVLVPLVGDAPTRPGLAFSVGHSGDLYCVVVGRERSVGVDVERLRHVARARSIAERWFGPGDRERFVDVVDEDLPLEFMRTWTAKEALAKRHGAGLRLMRGDRTELDVEAATAEETLRHFDPGEGYMGAIASTQSMEGLTIVRPEEDFWII